MKRPENVNLENKPKRQRATPGSIVLINAGGYYYYAQILTMYECAFFDVQLKEPLEDLSILSHCPVLFIICLYRDVISSGCWPKVGKLPIREGFLPLPMQYIHHDYSEVEWELYDPNTGAIRPSTREECLGLECCAVWDRRHVEDRLSDHYAGVSCKWTDNMREHFDSPLTK